MLRFSIAFFMCFVLLTSVQGGTNQKKEEPTKKEKEKSKDCKDDSCKKNKK